MLAEHLQLDRKIMRKKIEIHKILEMFSLDCLNLEMHRLIYGQYMLYNNDTGIVPRFNRFINVSTQRTLFELASNLKATKC